jgi:hypothetical protein
LLTLYGLYKQAVNGNCPYPRPEDSVDAGMMSKWKVWNDVKGLTKQQAAVQYIATIMSYDPSWLPPGDPIPGVGNNSAQNTTSPLQQSTSGAQILDEMLQHPTTTMASSLKRVIIITTLDMVLKKTLWTSSLVPSLVTC